MSSNEIETIEKNIESLRNNLLDMSLRNNLLNFRPLKKTIEINGENIIELFDILVLKEKYMRFLPNDDIDEFIFEKNTIGLDSENPQHFDSNLQTNYESIELKKKLTTLHNQNKLSLEEQGYNTLFLALGFLNWKEIEHSDRINKAPLILIPIDIGRSSVNSPYKIKWNGEDIKYNLSLQYKLQEQNIAIPNFEEYETKDDLFNYFEKVKKEINNLNDWSLSTEIYLSNFSFKKHIMFEDLNLENWNDLTNNGVKNLFLFDDDEKIYNSVEVSNHYNDNIPSTHCYNVLDADSSQLEVLNEVKKGKNLVVEGPPGTGKSQTIVNIIAELLANDKKILFVSEKKAALDVVKSRLENIGLGESCLELHGKNSNKKAVLEELKKTLELHPFKIKDNENFQNLDKINNELNNYIETLHKDYKNTELSPYDLIGILELNTQKLKKYEIIEIDMDDLSSLNKEQRINVVGDLKELYSVYELIKPISKSPWIHTSTENLSTKDINNLTKKFEEISYKLDEFEKINEDIDNLGGIKSDDLNLKSLIENSKILQPNLKLFKNNDVEELERLIEDIETFQSKTENIDMNILNMEYSTFDQISDFNNTMDKLNVNYKIIEDLELNSTKSNFENLKETVDNSNLKPLLNNELLDKLKVFKETKDSWFKRKLGSNYKRIKAEFSSYYDNEVSDETIIKDLENIIEINSKLNNLRNKINSYYSHSKDDETILIEIEVLKNWVNNLDTIKNDLNQYELTINSFNNNYKTDELKKLKELKTKINQSKIGEYYFGELWSSHKSDTTKLKSFLNILKEFNELYNKEYFNEKTIECVNKNKIEELQNLINKIIDSKKEILNLHAFLNDKLNFKVESSLNSIKNSSIPTIKENIQKYLDNIDYLSNYRLFEKYCLNYSNNITNDLIEKIKEDKIKSEEMLISLFYYNFSNTLLDKVFSNFKELDEFNYKIHENKIEEFKKLDLNSLDLNKYLIKEKLSEKRPVLNNQISPNSSLGILNREMSKKRRLMSIRKLLSKTKDAISSIKPCFMMSPLSIAQFLSPDSFESYFDYIIFDEASQVKVEDAVGAMFRGKKYIVMGDTKQLPPTSFFETEVDLDEEEYEENYTKDLESILHLCKNTFNSKMLKWHYRSRHESLISVSNQEFYNNKLYVFPSPMKKSDDLGLKFEYNPDTVYDRGKSRNNIKEAENIVDYAINCIKKYKGKKSVGIGTFSTSQRNAIEDILEKKLETDPLLEEYFNENTEEEFFIKNLENIQGDERDIILISMGYGKDVNGKLHMNFGPLNQEGGERRLNVLITRAKEKCVIFSNFKSSDLHITENTSLGVKSLKTFLYYAETGDFPQNYHTGEDFDSEFEESVYNFLTDEGYQVEKQVGCAGYKIDLAIVDKEDADKYILAIECDGANYHSSPLARDRDRLRQQVLEGLGWKFHRIWSTDWYHSKKQAKIRLLKAVEEAIENKNVIKTVEKYESDVEKYISKNKDQENSDVIDYTYYSVDDTLSYYYNIKEIIDIEGPIHTEEIYNRIKVGYNKRATKKFKREIDSIINSLVITDKIIKKEEFYYPNNQSNDLKVRKRIKPNIDYISPEEIELAIISILKMQYTTEINDLIKSTSQIFGFKKLNAKTKNAMSEIINCMIKSQKISMENNFIDLKKNSKLTDI